MTIRGLISLLSQQEDLNFLLTNRVPRAALTRFMGWFSKIEQPLVRDLSIAESSGQLLQEGSGYARTVGSGEAASPAPGVALMDKWAEVRARHGRKARYRAV